MAAKTPLSMPHIPDQSRGRISASMTASRLIERSDFGRLFAALLRRGYTIVGPTVYDEIGSASDLPVWWTDEQDGGRSRRAA